MAKELIFASLKTMKKILPGLTSEIFVDESLHWSGPDKAFELFVGNNPDVLVVYDTQTRLLAKGQFNCFVCTKYDQGHCNWGLEDKTWLGQKKLLDYSIGGCPGVDLTPLLKEEFGEFPSREYNDLMDSIVAGEAFRWTPAIGFQLI